jgi:hypothetical protein
MKRPIGTIVKSKVDLQGQRLKVTASVRMDSGEVVEAQMPDREVSAILPRSVLVGAAARAPVSLLDTVRPIIERMSDGRRARLWQYKDRWFLSFQPWRGVRFVEDEPAAAAEAATAGAAPAGAVTAAPV